MSNHDQLLVIYLAGLIPRSDTHNNNNFLRGRIIVKYKILDEEYIPPTPSDSSTQTADRTDTTGMLLLSLSLSNSASIKLITYMCMYLHNS